jgi:hypothetical protein
MRRGGPFVAAVMGLAVALALPGLAVAQAPTQDSVVLTGSPARAGPFSLLAINATSGPSGENATGEVRFDVAGFSLGGPVTCLAVNGNSATINFQDTIGPFGLIKVQVLDSQPDIFDSSPTVGAPTDCSTPLSPTIGISPLSTGDIVVIDAPPVPTSKEQCKNGGWRDFGVFKNEGDCVSFVATGGTNPPGN